MHHHSLATSEGLFSPDRMANKKKYEKNKKKRKSSQIYIFSSHTRTNSNSDVVSKFELRCGIQVQTPMWYPSSNSDVVSKFKLRCGIKFKLRCGIKVQTQIVPVRFTHGNAGKWLKKTFRYVFFL